MCSGAVEQVEFTHDIDARLGRRRRYKILERQTTRQSGEMKSSDAVPGVKFASSVEQVVGKNLIPADGDILRMFKIEGTCGGQRQGRQRQGANQARGLIGKAVKKWIF